MGRTHRFGLGLLALTATFAACSASDGGGAEFDDSGDASTGGAGATSGTGGSPADGDLDDDGLDPTSVGGSSSSGGTTCVTDPAVDDDLDGLSEDAGDCNDCDPNVHPGSIEVIATSDSGSGGAGGAGSGSGGAPAAADENCDNMIDNVLPPCDAGLAVDDADPNSAAKAVDLCQAAEGLKWGVISANYVRANGTVIPANLAIGILDNFGPNVATQGGERLLALSSGHGRRPGDPGACGTFSCSTSGAGTAPPNFPQDTSGCPGGSAINDDVGFEVAIRSPKNATGYSFNFKFYSFEYPEWLCDFYNDQFISLVSPPPMGSMDGNISFDPNGNPVSVNVAFFDVCAGCAAGTAELTGNGFDIWNDAGGTSWLKTTAPITGGEDVTIRWAIWDTEDDAWDSTALVDNFQWVATGGTPVVGTEPVPDPK
jgi:hypothetical protein